MVRTTRLRLCGFYIGTARYTGTAPVDNGSLVALRDGRLLMIGSGTQASHSKNGGRTWTPAEAIKVNGKPLGGAVDPTSLIRLKSDKLALLYGRDARAVGAPPGHDLFFLTSSDEGQTGQRKLLIRPIKWLYQD